MISVSDPARPLNHHLKRHQSCSQTLGKLYSHRFFRYDAPAPFAFSEMPCNTTVWRIRRMAAGDRSEEQERGSPYIR